MPNLEPTYLRYVYDGLNKGSLNAENAAALPQGFIGLYEQEFTQKTPASERKKVLNQLALWALFKGPVSANLAAIVLQMEEEQMKDLVDTYSSWFNSPESGKYQLYHERLRVYLLQKLSQREIIAVNQFLIEYLKKQLDETTQNESVLYCFEHLSFHAYFHAQASNNHALLGDLCLNESFKERQFKLSKFYDWEEQLMQYGISYFSLEGNPFLSKIVFEKTKIQFKRKNIDLILDLIRRSEFDIVFDFFKSINEMDLLERVKLVYYYLFSFFEIFEHNNLKFIQKKTFSSQLLDIFNDSFQWDTGYYLSQFIDGNFSFRLHCYFEKYGLDFTHYAQLSCNELNQNSDLKFIDINHVDEAKHIIGKLKQFDYDNAVSMLVDKTEKGDTNSVEGIISHENNSLPFNGYLMLQEDVKRDASKKTHTQLFLDDFSYISDNVNSFNEMHSLVKYCLGKTDINRQLKAQLYGQLRDEIEGHSNFEFVIIGSFVRDTSGNNLSISPKNENFNTKSADEIITTNYFITLDSQSRYNALRKIEFNEENEAGIIVQFFELNMFYISLKGKDIFDLCAALTIEFYLDNDSNLIEDYQNELIDYLVNSEHQTEFFEKSVFSTLMQFLNQAEVNGHIENTLSVLKETLMDIYFDFRYYQYSFASGVSIINLYSKNEIPFPETEIFERIIEDLNELIEGDDYDEFWPIENCSIDNLIDKDYCDAFLKAIGQIKYENIKESFLDNITVGIINTKGLNFKTISFIKQKMTEYPIMYQRGLDKLSEEAAKTSNDISYYLLRSDNNLLLKRLLFNTVSKIDNLSDPLNQQILKYYNLNWVLRLYDDYLEISNTKTDAK